MKSDKQSRRDRETKTHRVRQKQRIIGTEPGNHIVRYRDTERGEKHTQIHIVSHKNLQ